MTRRLSRPVIIQHSWHNLWCPVRRGINTWAASGLRMRASHVPLHLRTRPELEQHWHVAGLSEDFIPGERGRGHDLRYKGCWESQRGWGWRVADAEEGLQSQLQRDLWPVTCWRAIKEQGWFTGTIDDMTLVERGIRSQPRTSNPLISWKRPYYWRD